MAEALERARQRALFITVLMVALGIGGAILLATLLARPIFRLGLIGSTEWGEANAEWLAEHSVAYMNADTAVNGPHFRGAGGSPPGARFIVYASAPEE